MTRNWTSKAIWAVAAILIVAGVSAGATPKEAVGFRGKATGTVKSAQAGGLSFVLTVIKAEGASGSAAKDDAAIAKKDLTLGTRMRRTPDGKSTTPWEEDVAFIKSLKAGMVVDVEIFAVKADPTVLRIVKPGTIHAAATEPGKK